MAIANVFHASILNVTPENLMVELTGSAQTLNSFIECYKPYTIEKFCVQAPWRWKNKAHFKQTGRDFDADVR